jgi:hypothetical protein
MDRCGVHDLNLAAHVWIRVDAGQAPDVHAKAR